MRILTFLSVLAMYLASGAQSPGASGQVANQSIADRGCGSLGKAHTRTTLYFGLTRPTGTVTERQWRNFLRKEVTPRFPNGLTVWEEAGQWRRPDGRIDRERAKVLLLVHSESPEVQSAVTSLITSYKRSFAQESVLWETAPVCAAF